MASTKTTTAQKVWKGSHRYGCKCDGTHSGGGGRQASSRYTDGSAAPCHPSEPCPTATVEWNAVRAGFAQADALKSLTRIASQLEELATAPLMGTDKDALSAVASAISSAADALRESDE